ncbi:MAG: hypothetical protein ABF629_11605 [Sporolactobacillus sp.]
MSLVLVFLCLFYFWALLSGIHVNSEEQQRAKWIHWNQDHSKKRRRLYIENAIVFVVWLGAIGLTFNLGHVWISLSALIFFVIVALINFTFRAWAANPSITWEDYNARTQSPLRIVRSVAGVCSLLVFIMIFYHALIDATMIDQLLAHRDELSDLPLNQYIIMWVLICLAFPSLVSAIVMKGHRYLGKKEEVKAVNQLVDHYDKKIEIPTSDYLLPLMERTEASLHVPKPESILKKGKIFQIVKLIIGAIMLICGLFGGLLLSVDLGNFFELLNVALTCVLVLWVLEKWMYRFAARSRQDLWRRLIRQLDSGKADEVPLSGKYWQYTFAEWVRELKR